MSSGIQVNTGEMRAQSNDLRAAAQAYNACTQDVIATGRALCNMWEGDANQEFRRILDQDAPEFEKLYNEILGYCGAIEESANDYERTQGNIVQNMQGTGRR